MLMWIANVGLGLVLGGVGGMFGIGGGLMAIPVLVWLFGMDQTLAQGTALVMVVPNVALGFWRYKQRNAIQWRPVACLGLAAVASATVTAWWVTRWPSHHLQGAFAVFLLVIAALAARGAWQTRGASKRVGQDGALPRLDNTSAEPPTLPDRGMVGLGLISGVCSGLFTVGGGLVVAPALTTWFGVRRQTLAQGLGLSAVVPGAVAALGTYAMAGQVNWSLGVPMALGGLAGISWGVALAHRWPEPMLRGAFCVILLLTAAALV